MLKRLGVFCSLEYYLACLMILGILMAVSMPVVFWFLFWVDMSMFLVYPAFVSRFNKNISFIRGLMVLMAVSSVSSSFMFMGFIQFEYFYYLVLIAFLMKFNVFPFLGWSFVVLNNCGWFVFGILVSVSKFPWIQLCYVNGCFSMLNNLVSISFIALLVGVWVYCWVWRSFLSYMMISSSISLVIVLFGSNNGVMDGVVVWLMSSLWSLVCVVFSWSNSDSNGRLVINGIISKILYCYLFIAFPLSASFFYKVYLGYCLLGTSWLVCICWFLYSVSEQYYVWNFLVQTTEGGTSPLINRLSVC